MKKHLLTAALVASTAASAQAETIGFSMQRFDDNFLTIVRAALEKRAKELGNVKVIIEDAQGDVSRQQSQIENYRTILRRMSMRSSLSPWKRTPG